MLNHDAIIDGCLALGPEVRYVAVYRDGLLRSRQRSGLAGASEGESDKYEELLVNPALLTLVRQRGSIDCGGVHYLAIRYGNFFACVFPVAGGHVAVALEPQADLQRYLGVVGGKLAEWCGAA